MKRFCALLVLWVTTVVAQVVPLPPGKVYGVLGEYWENKDFAGVPSVRRTETEINFPWGGGGPFFPRALPLAFVDATPSSTTTVDGFTARWSGTITAPVDGDYTFYIGSDDGARMWLDFGTLLPPPDANGVIYDTWVEHSYLAVALRPVKMKAGVPVPFKMEFFESGGDARATLEWSATNPITGRLLFPQQIVPFSAYRSLDPYPPTVQCLPYEIGGSGGPFYVVSNADGRAIWWRCADRIRTIATLIGYIPPITCSSPVDEFGKAFAAVANDYLAAFNVALQKCTSPAPIGSPDYLKLNGLFVLAAADAKRVYPAQVVWAVAKNAAMTTRPAYTLANGALTAATVRAPVDALCDCKTPFVKGTSTYCIFNSSTNPDVPQYSVNEVALCVKRP